MEEADAAVRVRADAGLQISIPAAHQHVELVVIVGAAIRIPLLASLVRPCDFDPQRVQWMHGAIRRHRRGRRHRPCPPGRSRCLSPRIRSGRVISSPRSKRGQCALVAAGGEQRLQVGAMVAPQLDLVAVGRLVVGHRDQPAGIRPVDLAGKRRMVFPGTPPRASARFESGPAR